MYGDRIGIFAVQGFLFFGNGGASSNSLGRGSTGRMTTPTTRFSRMLAHATGADASAVDALLKRRASCKRRIDARCRRSTCAGRTEDVRRALRRRQASGGAAVKQSLGRG